MRILFLDHGLNLELALLLGRAGHQVAYHVSAVDKHSLHDVHLMGRGFKEITKVDSWVGLTDTVDLICSPDCHLGEVVDWARNKQIPTWGAGSTATKLELDRWFAAKEENLAGLPTVGVQRVVGVPNLIKELQKSGEFYVKCSGFREIETFKHSDWTATQEQFIAPLLQAYGADPNLEFVLTQPIDPAVEVGADNILLNGRVGSITPYGYEDKDTGYIGVLDRTLPPSLERINRAMLPHFKDYSTFFSTEARVVPDGQGYPIDLTVRAAHPVLAGMLVSVYNLVDTITNGSQPDVESQCAFMAVLVGESAWAEEHPVEVKFPEKLRNYVKLAKAQCRHGRFFTVPSQSYPVQVVGVGPTSQGAAKMCKFNVEQVKGKDLVFDLSSMDKLVDETIPEGMKYGIDF